MNASLYRRGFGVVVLIALCLTGAAEAAVRSGMSLGFGAGGWFPKDDDGYAGASASGYGELQWIFDVGPVNFGFLGGFIYADEIDDYIIAYVPAQFRLQLLPVRFARQSFPVQPYVGIGAGALIAVGDNDNSYTLITPQLGLEFQLSRFWVIGLGFQYNMVRDVELDERGGSDLDYYTATLSIRVRIPFTTGD